MNKSLDIFSSMHNTRLLVKGAGYLYKLNFFNFLSLTELLKLDNFTLPDLTKEEGWVSLKNQVDPSGSWTYFCLYMSIYKSYKHFKNIKLHLALKKNNYLDLFKNLAIHNGLLLYLHNYKKNAAAEDNISILDEYEHTYNYWECLQNLNITHSPEGEKLNFYNFFEKMSYYDIELISTLGSIKIIEKLRTSSPMGLSEEGEREVNKTLKRLRNVLTLSEEKSYRIYVSDSLYNDKDRLYSPEIKEKLRVKLGEDSCIYKDYLYDYEGKVKNVG